MKKNILQLGAGELHSYSIEQIKAAGYFVHAMDKNPNAPAGKNADFFFNGDITNIDQVTDYARANNISAIIAVNDAGVIPAAEASYELGLKNVDVKAARLATDKGLMRERWRSDNLSQPAFFVAESLHELLNIIENTNFPVIIKPCLNWGSRGVSCIASSDDIDFSIKFLLENDRNGRYIIEDFIDGIEMTYEGLVISGKVEILSRSDKLHRAHKNFKVAMQLNYPPNIPGHIINEADELVKSAAVSLGIKNGAIHCEVIVSNSGVFLIEMAARPGGGHIFSQIVEAQSGVPMPLSLVKIFLNEGVDVKPKFNRGVCYRFFAPPNGMFKYVHGIEEAKNRNGVLDIGFTLTSGSIVDDISNDAQRPGYLVTVADNRNKAIELSNEIISEIKFEMF